jgi:hypothetical protein
MQLHPPPRSRRGCTECSSHLFDVKTERDRRSSGRYGVGHLMAPGELKPNRHMMISFALPTLMECEAVPPVRITNQFGSPDALLEWLDDGPGQYLSRGPSTHRPNQWIVNVQHCPTISWQGLDEFTFGLRNCRLSTKFPYMGLADIQHKTDPRWRDVTQIGNVADATSAHLSDQEFGFGVNTTHGKRNPELVIEIARRRNCWAVLLEHLRQKILGRGLADRARDADDLKACSTRSIDQVSREPAERDQRIDDHQALRVCDRISRESCCRTCGYGGGDIVMTVRVLTA